MTKRTAAIAASKQKNDSSASQQGDEPQTKKVTPRKKQPPKKTTTTANNNNNNNTNSNTTKKPWYTVYTKSDPEYDTYMSTEWGMEKRGDVPLFEKLCLEGAQSGLSWQTILKKREAYRRTFFDFDIDQVAQMTDQDVQAILDTTPPQNPRDIIVRHRGKIEATIHNAKCVLELRNNTKNGKNKNNNNVLDQFLWSFVKDKPILNTTWKQGESLSTARTTSPQSHAMSQALKQRGFKFVGPTTCYALMQSTGMVIDHPVGSPEWHAAVKRLEQRPGGYQNDTDTVDDNKSEQETSNDNNKDSNSSKPKATSKKSKKRKR